MSTCSQKLAFILSRKIRAPLWSLFWKRQVSYALATKGAIHPKKTLPWLMKICSNVMHGSYCFLKYDNTSGSTEIDVWSLDTQSWFSPCNQFPYYLFILRFSDSTKSVKACVYKSNDLFPKTLTLILSFWLTRRFNSLQEAVRMINYPEHYVQSELSCFWLHSLLKIRYFYC